MGSGSEHFYRIVEPMDSSSVRVDGLSVQFSEFTLGPINLDLDRASVTCLLGLNGSGKSTLLRAMLGLVSAEHGAAYLGEQPLARRSPTVLSNVGYVSDSADDTIPEMSAGEYWTYCARVYEARRVAGFDQLVKEAFRLGRLLEISSLTQPARTLSLGNRRKLQIVAGLMHQPQFLVLDEPFSGLDFLAAHSLEELIVQARARGSTVLLSTHDLAVAERVSDRVLLLSRGALRLSLSPSSMSSTGFRQAVIHEAQVNDA